MSTRYDALLLVSFGGPEAPDEVMPFLENVTRGRVPRAHLEEVAGHYLHFGGVSPINAQNRALAAALREELRRQGLPWPVYLGNRCWHPFLVEAVRRMAADGVRRALAFITSAFSSHAGCRQYLDAIAEARAKVGPRAPVIDRIRPFWNHPAFIALFAENTAAALARIPDAERAAAHVLFTAHSLPLWMARSCEYEAQLDEACRLIVDRLVEPPPWSLAYQSRSGPPDQPWLEPDVSRRLVELAAEGVEAVVLVPVGFLSDHMEVVYDLDVEVREQAERLGLRVERAATPGDSPAFVAMIVELVRERCLDLPPRWLGSRGPAPATCPPGCCEPGTTGEPDDRNQGAACGETR